ncbi:MAG: Rho termination factor N-terminal domain-containing protein, partial [Mycobacteriales bacterium]
MNDTTDLLAADTGQEQEASAPPATRTRRRATSGGTVAATSAPAPATAPKATSPKGGGLGALLLPELQSLAADLGLSGTGKLRKSQLIEAIQAQQSAAKTPEAAPDAQPEPTRAPERAARETADDRDIRADRDAGNARDASNARDDDSDDDDADDDGDDNSSDRTSDGRPDGERPSRVDRGRERFLEREAKRQERVEALVAEGLSLEEATAAVAAERPQRDRQNPDRTPRQDRQERQPAPAGQAAQGAQARQGEGPREDDEDEFGNRRGRFRERGRGRGRNRDRTYPGSGEPELAISDDDVLLPIAGILDILDNYGFVRTTGYLTGPNDVYVSLQQVRKYDLRRGDAVTGAVRQLREGEQRAKYNALVRLDTINGLDPEESKRRPEFGKLTPLYPQDRLRLETTPDALTTRVIDLVMPVGKGQRALIVSPPKAGKTMVLQAIANAITTNNPECHLMVVLVDERPEEVTDMQRSVKGEVIAS